VMEPFISLGLKDGAHIIAASFYRGGEVISADLTPEQRKAYYDAENEAVDLINADFYKYAHHVTAHAKGALKPTELLRTFVRYKHVDYYDVELPVLLEQVRQFSRRVSGGQAAEEAP
jgi:NitT/TauT family transport system substrate-binding protein